jgi:hypothetical protein
MPENGMLAVFLSDGVNYRAIPLSDGMYERTL